MNWAASIAQTETPLPADSVEFSPFPEYSQTFVCANYKLDESTRRKYGALHLISTCSSESDESKAATSVLLTKSTVETRAIFDVKWCYRKALDDRCLFGAVDASGYLSLYSLTRDASSQPTAPLLSDAHISSSESVSSLSLDFNNRVTDCPLAVCVSHSDSHLSLVTIAESELVREHHWLAHEYETWIAAFDYHNPHLVYSGADDTLFRGWDTRQPLPLRHAKPLFTNKSHGAGVCSIQSNPHNPHLLATGSYDESLRFWDPRKLVEPIAEYQAGAGVWRVRWHPTDGTRIVTACMRNGFHSGKLTEELKFIADEPFVPNMDLAYGVDWQSGDSSVIAGCTFYDRQVFAWTPTPRSEA